ncbi:hypothetical protein [Streptomyces otsuchiensis]|uniref:hypothetical protein n=1 Tax=Streptomyces otsuchiensis TaxID=2681388 RepID=UPI0010313EE7|nr:hypothetical protein [Streptomyces otsuchiensis]
MHSLRASRGPLAVARDRTGRLLTAAGALTLGAGALTPDLYPLAAATAAGAAAFGAAWSLTLPTGRARDIATALYIAPALTHATIATTTHLVPGTHWWEITAAALWTGAVWWVRPARLARILVGREPSLVPAAIEEEDQEQQEQAAAACPIIPAGQHPVLTWWQQHAATDSGPATGTTLEDITQPAPGTLRATIRATTPGTPVPTISTTALSALMDIPEDDIRIGPVPGRGAGVRRLTVGRTPTTTADDGLSLADMWEQQIAPKGMPGTVITAVRAVPVQPDGAHGAPADLTKTREEITQ